MRETEAEARMDFFRFSISGAVFVLIILILRAVFAARLPKGVLLGLWSVALIKLLLPFSLPVPPGLMARYLELDEKASARLHSFAVFRTDYSVEVTGTFVTGDFASLPAAELNQAPAGPENYWFAVWLLGFILLSMFFLVNYRHHRRRYLTALPLMPGDDVSWLGKIKVRQSDQIGSPLVYGFFRPVILLPKWLDLTDERRLYLVLYHEFLHVRHLDLWKKALMLAAVCLHWFNPLVWLMFYFFNRDIEFGCDARLLKKSGAGADEYARVLLELEAKRRGFSPLAAYFSQPALEKRMLAIIRKKQRPAASLAVTLLCMALLTITASIDALAFSAAESNATVAVPMIYDGFNVHGQPEHWDALNLWLVRAEDDIYALEMAGGGQGRSPVNGSGLIISFFVVQ
jgi:beta-lactamase regulating signal transducer with metallopeptidase domain